MLVWAFLIKKQYGSKRKLVWQAFPPVNNVLKMQMKNAFSHFYVVCYLNFLSLSSYVHLKLLEIYEVSSSRDS